MKSTSKNSEAIENVWLWKKEIYEEHKNINVKKMINSILEDASKVAEDYFKKRNPTTPSSG